MKGKFKPETKFLRFVSNKKRTKSGDDITEAYLDGKFISCDGMKFKCKIYDDGTIDFDEVDTDYTSDDRKKNLIQLIEDKTISATRSHDYIVREIEFQSIDSEEKLYLSVEYKPYAKLEKLFDNKEQKTSKVVVDQDKISKLQKIFGLFETDTQETEITQPIEVSDDSSHKDKIKQSFKEMKKEKKLELQTKLDKLQMQRMKNLQDLQKLESDIESLQTRLNDMIDEVEPNGIFFWVSERKDEKVQFEPEIQEKLKKVLKKVKSINVDGFMKLFEIGEYHIEFYDKEMKVISSSEIESNKTFLDLNLQVHTDNHYVYKGDLEWHEIVQSLAKAGFQQINKPSK